MFFRKQARLGMWLSSVLTLLMLVIYCVNITSAQQLEAGASVNIKKLDKRATVEAYNTLLVTAMRAFMKYLTDPSDTEALEKLVAMSNDFIAAHPLSERIGEVYYYLGKALVRLGRVETGIATLEKLIKDTPPDRVDVKYYSGGIGYRLRWHPLEHGSLELGLAYDKRNQHDKADAVYKKLITHPEFAGGLQAGIARQILELDTALRIGEVPKVHNAWIGQTAPNFRIEDTPWKQSDLHQYRGKVVLLYYGTTDTPSLKLKVVHSKYKNKRFQLITANADVSEPLRSKPIVKKGSAWIHYHDIYGKLVNLFQIRALPAVFLVDSDGIVRKTHLDGASLEKAVEELVTENSATYTDPRTQKIIAAAVEAHGGLEKLKAVENIVYNFHSSGHQSEGSIDAHAVAKIYLTRDKFRMDWSVNTSALFTRIFDGTAIYKKTGDGTYEQVPLVHAKFLIDIYKNNAFRQPIWLLTTLAQNEIPIQYVGTENVGGVAASVLRVRQPSGAPLKIFISEKTGYIVQFVNEQGAVNRVLSFEQYKDVDGIKISHHWIEKHQWHDETSLSNISFNAEIDPELFNPKE